MEDELRSAKTWLDLTLLEQNESTRRPPALKPLKIIRTSGYQCRDIKHNRCLRNNLPSYYLSREHLMSENRNSYLYYGTPLIYQKPIKDKSSSFDTFSTETFAIEEPEPAKPKKKLDNGCNWFNKRRNRRRRKRRIRKSKQDELKRQTVEKWLQQSAQISRTTSDNGDIGDEEELPFMRSFLHYSRDYRRKLQLRIKEENALEALQRLNQERNQPISQISKDTLSGVCSSSIDLPISAVKSIKIDAKHSEPNLMSRKDNVDSDPNSQVHYAPGLEMVNAMEEELKRKKVEITKLPKDKFPSMDEFAQKTASLANSIADRHGFAEDLDSFMKRASIANSEAVEPNDTNYNEINAEMMEEFRFGTTSHPDGAINELFASYKFLVHNSDHFRPSNEARQDFLGIFKMRAEISKNDQRLMVNKAQPSINTSIKHAGLVLAMNSAQKQPWYKRLIPSYREKAPATLPLM